jgi:hypothetical protein
MENFPKEFQVLWFVNSLRFHIKNIVASLQPNTLQGAIYLALETKGLQRPSPINRQRNPSFYNGNCYCIDCRLGKARPNPQE